MAQGDFTELIYHSSQAPVGISATTDVDRLLGIGVDGSAKVVGIANNGQPNGNFKVVVGNDIIDNYATHNATTDKVYSCHATAALVDSKIQNNEASDAQTTNKTYSCKAIRALVAASGGGGVPVVGYASGNRSHEDEAYHCKGTHDAIAADISSKIETTSTSSAQDDTKMYSCKATNTLVNNAKTTIIGASGTAGDNNVYSSNAVQTLIAWEPSGQNDITTKNNKGVVVGSSGNWADSTLYGDLTIKGSNYPAAGSRDARIIFDTTSSTPTYEGTLKFSFDNFYFDKPVYASSFYESSDASLKDNAAPISEPRLKAAASVPLMEFDWKKDGSHCYGTIAQECEMFMPEVVGTDADGKKSVNYIALLCAKVAALEKEVAELKSKIQ